ncbi:hypothetical protein G5B38_17060 [Pseudohalocynthiibacter aestuariivivens]|uniref:Arginine transporter n=1 Tax=Roseovarius pelagicus TaxID=2980108 RepID=A0ABY6DET2_9RHOB|nr:MULTISPECIES: hypothetical protein [Rhodobacterales]QIE47096.1 hypothetical protein G5B38_17060 [Pseudohalocynthiibacter aestuariivivens]UXX84354.1 hypothetical protein N7U68_06830 [Roseovarius pelagicus]
MKNILIMGLILALAGCGGVHRFKSKPQNTSTRVAQPARLVIPSTTPRAHGPLSQACLASDRKARSPERCGCIQAVADQSLSGTQQRRAATFYSDPQKAQDVRMSDRASDELFWETYVEYATRAKKICS